VLDEIPAVHHSMARANPGDLVVLCVDKHGPVLAELEILSSQAQAGTHPRPRDDHAESGVVADAW
jgi:cyanophycin synthetase